MKYFTLDWWIATQLSYVEAGSEKDAEIASLDSAAMAYRPYFESVRDRLPSRYVDLSNEVTIHDGHVRHLSLREGTLRIVLDASDITERELRRVALTFRGVDQIEAISDPMKYLAGPSGFGDLGYDEIEVVCDGVFKLSLLFSSGIELQITFREFDFETLT